MTFETQARLQPANDHVCPHERLKRASRALALALEEQRQVFAHFQGKMDALEKKVSSIGDVMTQAHDSLGDVVDSLRKS